ncbi:MAG: T9SS type A sorting domain-containing protein [Candidatus Handelsmanbacteria bacterium]|nr:T9SS type A sorting domain-containing protein [Candidatus Handelsmanbacteria bacterium]
MKALPFLLAIALAARAQPPPATLSQLPEYKNWGWGEVAVLENGLITLAVVPRIGARVMQYDLGGHQGLFLNPAELGKLYEPTRTSPWHNYGGFKNWPAPQDRWGWPPPPILDAGVYGNRVAMDTPDSVALWVSSPVEQWKTPNLRFERRLTLYRGSSRVRVEQTLVNEGAQAASWSVWDITQHRVHHPGERDFENFWVYFPLNPESRYGAAGVRTTEESNAWKGEVAPGVFGVQFLPENQKLFADSPEGWICYADEREGYIYAKTFDLFAGQEYPDQGAHVEVWLNKDPPYLEVEVVSPVAELAPTGGRYTFVEDWWAARVKGPILRVNPAGALARPLVVEEGLARASCGVFHQGTAQVVLLDEVGQQVGQGALHPVTPLETLVLEEKLDLPPGAYSAELRVMDHQGGLVGVLDRVLLPERTAVLEEEASPSAFVLGQNYPNPFNPATTIAYQLEREGQVELAVYNLAGARLRTLVMARQPAGSYRVQWDGRDTQGRQAASGIYFYRLSTPLGQAVKRMVLAR